MIITRSPLRITLGGGGTDIPSYYREHGGFCVAAAIDKYVYITLHETFEPGITLKYSKVERVKSVDEIEHPIFREALRMVGIKDPHLEIASHADIPAGTGLGSSSAFTCALLKALYTYRQMDVPAHALAEMACELEIDRLGEPIGKQDQYISAFGGVAAMTFCADGTVEMAVFPKKIADLEDDLALFFTGYIRSASDVIKTQKIDNLDAVWQAGHSAYQVLREANFTKMGEQFNKQWDLKLERDSSVSDQIIDWRQQGLNSGARGGKLVGAGGGGFLLFNTWGKQGLRTTMFNLGLKEVRFKFDFEGTKVI